MNLCYSVEVREVTPFGWVLKDKKVNLICESKAIEDSIVKMSCRFNVIPVSEIPKGKLRGYPSEQMSARTFWKGL